MNTDATDFASSDEAKFSSHLSTLCAIYHGAINLSLEKERFKPREKSPDDCFTSVLRSLGLSMEFNDIIAHKLDA
ncbi:hypothetical protein VIOR3934_13652 [Vibrio orientalis CIP 102891 = ATCC 33934]|uniref:Uncharacterized protein n=1 Tax=Vibrio orientalis CIP 102891 = ATCC 33934 TaxID=675816 RepID=C9QK95_VIBOR|nr:hypothetical protein [Vibrio orientalis]EEX92090.1 hypothetical protein VIA_002734 [Vibrio orientalis CIP 102891 = ATCC 33934]EGU45543.1 hypothetical protein VIOR3934_13652 [Vibrio orientalis CIP 102891 = ATCC 33934]